MPDVCGGVVTCKRCGRDNDEHATTVDDTGRRVSVCPDTRTFTDRDAALVRIREIRDRIKETK